VTKSVKVSFVKEETSEAEATAAPIRPSATVVKVRMLAILELGVSGGAWRTRAAGARLHEAPAERGTYLFNSKRI
jgi:hypothetical protein